LSPFSFSLIFLISISLTFSFSSFVGYSSFKYSCNFILLILVYWLTLSGLLSLLLGLLSLVLLLGLALGLVFSMILVRLSTCNHNFSFSFIASLSGFWLIWSAVLLSNCPLISLGFKLGKVFCQSFNLLILVS